MLRLESAKAVAVVDPGSGGRLRSLVVGGHEVLVAEEIDPMRWGSFPMVPFAGRVRNGEFVFDGRPFRLPRNLGAHAIHGYGYLSQWDKIDECTIGFGFANPWPFAGEAVQRFDLTDEALSVSLVLTAHERQPLMAGWHPWFRRRLDSGAVADLEYGPARMYELDDEAIPTGRLIAPPPGPWDNCFTELRMSPQVSWGDDLRLQLTSTADHWVIFTEPADAFCVEPQTGPPNQLNGTPVVVEAGQQLAATFEIAW